MSHLAYTHIVAFLLSLRHGQCAFTMHPKHHPNDACSLCLCSLRSSQVSSRTADWRLGQNSHCAVGSHTHTHTDRRRNTIQHAVQTRLIADRACQVVWSAQAASPASLQMWSAVRALSFFPPVERVQQPRCLLAGGGLGSGLYLLPPCVWASTANMQPACRCGLKSAHIPAACTFTPARTALLHWGCPCPWARCKAQAYPLACRTCCMLSTQGTPPEARGGCV